MHCAPPGCKLPTTAARLSYLSSQEGVCRKKNKKEFFVAALGKFCRRPSLLPFGGLVMWLLAGSALGLTHMQRGIDSSTTLLASAPTVPVAPYQSVQEDARYTGVFSQPPASASVAAAPKLGCGVGPGINTHSCASCPYAFFEGVPAAAVGLGGAAISICTACEAGGSGEISAFSAARMHPKVSCFGGVELSEAVARAKGKQVALENALPQDTRTMLRSFEQTIESSAMTGAMKEQLKELKSMAAQAMSKSEGCPVSSGAVSVRRLADGSVAPEPVPAPDALLGKFEAAVQVPPIRIITPPHTTSHDCFRSQRP